MIVCLLSTDVEVEEDGMAIINFCASTNRADLLSRVGHFAPIIDFTFHCDLIWS